VHCDQLCPPAASILGQKNLCPHTIHNLQEANNIHRIWKIMPEFKFAILGKYFTKQTTSYKTQIKI
jgi:hypothetical protein